MDESLLSDRRVIEASRAFVCARLATYESADEARFLTTLLGGRASELRNTLFCVLAPDGKTALTRSGRSPGMVFGRGDEVASTLRGLQGIARRYPGVKAETPPAIPYHPDLRRALNVASCDLRPLIVVSATSDEARAKLEKALGPVLWSKAAIGRFEVARTADALDLALLPGAPSDDGVFVVAPDVFGLDGTVLAATTTPTTDAMRAMLARALKAHQPKAKTPNALVREARRKGIQWKSAIPATDGPGRR